MTSITLPLIEAKGLAKAMVPHASRDNITPVLTTIAVGGKHGEFAYASDRFTVGRYDLTNILIDGAPEEEFLIPAKALSAVAAVGKASLPNNWEMDKYHVRFDQYQAGKFHYLRASVVWAGDDEQRGMAHWMRTWTVPREYGNFPPIPNLFDKFIPSERERVALSANQLAKFTSYARQFSGIDAMRVTLAKPEDGRLTAAFLVEIGRRFKGLVQESHLLEPGEAQFGTDLARQNKERAESKSAEEEEKSDG